MTRAGLTAVALEAREALRTVQEKGQKPVGAVVVSGTLAPQLARELGAGAEPGAVVVRDPPSIAGAEVIVRVIAGDPGEAEDALVRAADAVGTPVVFVQLWPQANWRPPFVLSPYVIECRAGQGFPVPDIARAIARAVTHPEALAARVPVLERSVESSTVATAVARAALLGAVGTRRRGPARPLITLSQLRMLSSLRAAEGSDGQKELSPAAVAGATLAASFALRAAARSAARFLPVPLVNAAVAAGGTLALAELLRRLQARDKDRDLDG
ncbi:MAG: hypothetical protein M3364_00905 [Actinomycetota bacterium]|nr:hypothetical protein [Actinomycetota bacterium]